jgi:large subunit ribosomal protein L31
MKPKIHPTFYTNAKIICSCGNTWIGGSTKQVLHTDLCYNCHPFYTGEQRIIDTEGQVDRFMKKLSARQKHLETQTVRRESHKPTNLSISELGLDKRAAAALEAAGLHTIGEVVAKLQKDGDSGLLDLPAFGRKSLIDTKRQIRALGVDLAGGSEAES